MKKQGLVGVVVVGIIASAVAQNIKIDSVSKNGSMSFSGARIGTTATVEWAASLTDAGRTNWHALTNIVVTSDVMTNDIPMFFRVKGTPDTNVMNGLVLWYTFSNGAVEDLSGNNNTGVVHGAAVPTANRYGTDNMAYDFTRTSYVRVEKIPQLSNASGVTMAHWVKYDSYPPAPHRDGSGFVYGWDGPSLRISRGASGGLSAGVGNSWDNHITNSIPNGEWHHLAFVVDCSASNCWFYVDGVQVADRNVFTSDGQPMNIPSTFTVTGAFGIGCSLEEFWGPANEATDGKIDDFRLYNRALTPQDVWTLYNLED